MPINLFILYLIIIIFALLYRKYIQRRFIFHCIWFSEDGSVHPYAIKNIQQLSQKIKQHKYKKRYQIYFWTNKQKLKCEVVAQFKKINIEIKDYTSINAADKSVQLIKTWVQELVELKLPHSKLHFAMASDLLRMCIMFKESQRYFRTIHCYLDCNDMKIQSIPSIDSLKDLRGVAFNVVSMEYLPVIEALIHPPKDKYFVNNDIIITISEQKKVLNQLFTFYASHLMRIDKLTQGVIKKYKETLPTKQPFTLETHYSIAFLFAHPFAILRYSNESNKIYLIDYLSGKKRINYFPSVVNAFSFLNYQRLEEEGMSWILEHTVDNAGSSHWSKTYWNEVLNIAII